MLFNLGEFINADAPITGLRKPREEKWRDKSEQKRKWTKSQKWRQLVNGHNWLMDKKWTILDKKKTKNKRTKSGQNWLMDKNWTKLVL